MLNDYTLFQSFLKNNNDDLMNKAIGNYSFLYISQNFNEKVNLENNKHLQQSRTIMIHHYENKDENGYGLHFIIGFYQTILVIEFSLLPNILSYFTKNKKIKICFFPETKNIFIQKIKIKYNESEFHNFFLEEIGNMNNVLFKQYNKFLNIIKSCISGYLIKESYNDLNFDRINLFKNTSIESPNLQNELREINLNDYIELRTIGCGTQSKVELIYHIIDKKLYAVKKPNSYDKKTKILLNREINNYLEISHPFIPKLIGKVTENGISYPVIEFINGCDMYKIQYSAIEIFIIMFQLLIVFDYLHKNKKIFRDLKPTNIMIDKYKNLVLIDFDRAINENYNIDLSQITSDFSSIFAAPEINNIGITSKCDIYSIGKTFEYIINELKSKNVEIPYDEEIKKIICKCTNDIPINRPDIKSLILSYANLPISKKINIDKIDPNMQKLIGKLLFSNDIYASIYYYSLAANQNDIEAQLNLGLIYYEDKYVPQDLNKAIHYFVLAAGQKNKDAKLYIDSILQNKCTIYDLNNSTHIYSITSNHNFPEGQFCIGAIYYLGTYFPQNINEAIYFFTLAARKNHSQAQCFLGLIYYEGKHVQRNIEKAIYYFTLASAQDDPFASFYLGNIHFNGIGIPQDSKKAIQYYTQAANHNFAEAQFILGTIYDESDSIEHDIQKAIHYYKMAANQNHAEALYQLGEIYYDGIYVSRDIEKAILYYSMAANQNHADALYQLGEIYYEGIDIRRDIEKAIHFYSLAADKKHSEAQFSLGSIYLEGKYVIFNIANAIYYFLLAAKQNHPEALYALALLHHEGKYVPYNINSAIYYYTLSAKQNKPEAQFTLAVFYFEGKFISKDIEKAIYYFKLSAKQNYLDSQLFLGVLYQYGEYVVPDINKAIYYFSLAADQNNNRIAQYHLGEIYYGSDIKKSIHYLKLASNQNYSVAQYFLAGIYNERKYISHDINEVKQYLFLSAQNNNKEAQYSLAEAYLYGSKFMARDIDKGIHYLTLSANQNHSDAQLLLGHIYYFGSFDQIKNINKGLYWYQRASENKCIQAYFVLGFLYQEGKYLKFDHEKMIHFYKEASSFNNQYAKHNLGIIYKHGLKNIIPANLDIAKFYFNEAINQSNDFLAMYNLALIYIYEDETDESIKKSIDLLIKSSKLVILSESTTLLILVLIRNYKANKNNFKNVLLNFTDKEYADKLIESNYQIIEILSNLNILSNEKFEEIYWNFKENDLLYKNNLQSILVKDVFNDNINQEKKTIYEKYNITKDFYLGFE